MKDSFHATVAKLLEWAIKLEDMSLGLVPCEFPSNGDLDADQLARAFVNIVIQGLSNGADSVRIAIQANTGLCSCLIQESERELGVLPVRVVDWFIDSISRATGISDLLSSGVLNIRCNNQTISLHIHLEESSETRCVVIEGLKKLLRAKL